MNNANELLAAEKLTEQMCQCFHATVSPDSKGVMHLRILPIDVEPKIRAIQANCFRAAAEMVRNNRFRAVEDADILLAKASELEKGSQ